MRNEKIKNRVINCITTEIELIIEEKPFIGTTGSWQSATWNLELETWNLEL